MQLKSLRLYNFKNYTEAIFHFTKSVNCIIGENGTGKTNLLDAIYFLCLTKSYFNSIDQQLIRHGQPSFILEGDFVVNNVSLHVKCLQPRERKKEFYVNGVRYEKLSHHVGLLPVVMVTPDDHLLIYGSSEERRRFLDSTLSQISRTYLELLQAFNKLLAQRNALLKRFADEQSFDANLLLAYDRKLVPLNREIFLMRKTFVEELIPIFNAIYQWISGQKETVHLSYQSDLHEVNPEEMFLISMEKDRLLKRTTRGIQADDLLFRMGSEAVKKFGSQGQQKTFLLSLKLAQAFMLEKYLDKTPLLLLDDIFDKLDIARGIHLLQYINNHYKGQVFITDTQRERIEQHFSEIANNLLIIDVASHLNRLKTN